MKKLMTMIAAVAMSFGLFADGTFTNAVDFTSATNENPYATGDALWAYTADGAATDILADEVQVKDGALVLATGQKVLARKFAAEATAIGEGLYADMKLDLNGEALDEVPDVTGAKIALFALDGTEVAGLPNATNVYVYAAYGTDGGKALYKLLISADTFIGSARRIAVKSYASVVSGDTRAGFLIYAGADSSSEIANLVQVDEVYTLNGNTWEKVTLTDVAGDYLGGLTINPSYSKWIATSQRSLFVSMDNDPVLGAKLASVDFQGRGKITSITLTDDDPGFPADNATMAIEATDATVTAVEGEGAFLVGDPAEGISMPVADVVTVTISTEKGNITVKVGDVDATKVAEGKYQFTLVDGGELTVKGWDAAATVKIGEGEAIPFESFFGDDGALAYVNANGGTLKLAQAVTVGDLETEVLNFTGSDVVLDLNGQVITISGENKTLFNAGKLTITDSSVAQTGKIVGMIINGNNLIVDKGIIDGMYMNSYGEVAGVTIISNGTFESTVMNVTDGASESGIDPEEIKITAFGGQFATEGNDETTVNGFLPEEGGYEVVGDKDPDPEYWVVQKEVIKTGTVIFICEKTGLNQTNSYDVGTVVSKADFPAIDKDGIYTATWDKDSVEVTEGEQTVTATAAIEFVGEGTEAAPYQIANVTDLKKLQALVNDDKDSDVNHTAGVYFQQTDEIDMAGEVWAGIGYNKANGQYPGMGTGGVGPWNGGNSTFAGTYDGNGQTIKNIKFLRAEYEGFFNTLSNATIKALTMKTVGFAEGSESAGAGVLAGVVIDSTIQNVTIEGSIVNATHNVAGIAISAASTTFTCCTNNAAVTGLNNKRAAGILAFYNRTGAGNFLKFDRCANNGAICVKYNSSTSYGIGGFIGTMMGNAVTFIDCANNGAVTRTEEPEEGATRNIGSFIGVYTKAAGGSITATGCCTAQAGLASIGTVTGTGTDELVGLGFATFANDVATFVAPVNGGTYNVMFAGAPLELANKGDSVTLTPTFGTPVVTTSADDCAVQVEGNVYTVVANLYAVTWAGSENVVVSNGAAQVEGTSGSYETGTVLKFYATAGSITNVTVNGEAATVANPFEYTVNKAGATIVVLAGEDVKPLPPIDPTQPTDPMNKDAADAAAAEINAHPEKYIKVPTEFGEIGETALATYQTYFTAVVKGSGDNCTVVLELNAAGETALQNSVDTEIVKIKPADIAAGTADDVTITTIPGFYYGVKAGNGIGTMVIKSSVPGTGTELKLDLPSFTGSGFYTIVASPTPMTVVE